MNRLFILLLFYVLMVPAYAEKVVIKAGVIAPEGTTWANYLKKISKDVKEKTEGRVEMKIFYGGSQGDEPDVLRKIRIGQLHAGIFTGKALSEINGEVRVMEVPFTFYNDRDKAYSVLKKMTSYFNEGFVKNGFRNLGFYEIGPVYFVSQKKVENINGLKGVKIWLWEGDQLVAQLIKNLELTSVPLSITDVLTALQTGMVEAAYAPPTAMLAVQWHSKVNYLIDFSLAYSIAAFLVNEKIWQKISAGDRKIIEDITNGYTEQINQATAKENIMSLEAMKKIGVQFVEFPKEDQKLGATIRKKLISDLTGKIFSPNAVKRLEQLL